MDTQTFQIVNTEKSDLPFIYWLFDEAIAYQKRTNVPVWPDYDKALLKQDIEQQLQFKIIQEQSIACIFSVCYTDKIVWRERDKGNSIFLHRIVVNPNFKGQKQFGKILSFAKKHASKKVIKYIRMDTWADNPTLIKYYQNFGFKIVDYFTTPNSKDLPIQQRGNRIVLLEY